MNNSKPTPTRQAFHTVCESARRMGYRLIVTNGRTWIVKGLKWHVERTECVAAYLSTLDPRNAPSVAETTQNGDVEQTNDNGHVESETL